jgi:pimeloyl-ACP methyl ester carboxylesterase
MSAAERRYITVGDRQQHYRRCGKGPAVVLLHESPRSSAALLPLIDKLGDGFTIFALDTPGYGGSDPLPHARPEIEDYADALADTFDALGIERAPVYGTHTGALIAFEFARRHRDKCTVCVLDGFPVFTPNERERFLASYLPPFRPDAQGAHLAWLWSRVRDQFRFFPWNYRGDDARLSIPLPPIDRIHLVAMDFLAAGDGYRTGYAAAFRHDTGAALAKLDIPIVAAAREDDLLFSHLDRIPKLPEGSHIVRLSADRDAWGKALREVFIGHAGEVPAPAPVATALLANRPSKLFQRTSTGASLVRAIAGGTGRPLVLLHQCPGGSADFIDAMRRHGRTRPVYALDLPGNGDSDALGAGVTLKDHAAAVTRTLDALGLTDADLAADGIGATVALAMAEENPKRYSNVMVANVPLPGAPLPPSLLPEAFGEHLIRAWHTVRDDAIHGAWCARRPDAPHRFGSSLDMDAIHRRTVDALKGANPLDLCKAALAAQPSIPAAATMLPGTTPLADRLVASSRS